MKRITLVLGVVAVMAAMMVALAAPAMADKDNDGRGDRHGVSFNDHKFDRDFDHRFDRGFDHGFVSFDNDFHRWPWWGNNWGNHEVCWWEWSWVFERWDLECD